MKVLRDRASVAALSALLVGRAAADNEKSRYDPASSSGRSTMHAHTHEEAQDSLRPQSVRPKGSRPDLTVSDHESTPSAQPQLGGPEQLLGLQRAAGNAAVAGLMEEERSPVHDVINSGGRPLEPEVRGDMESRLGADFSDVRIHDDSAAAASAAAVNAHAYTVGRNVVFQRDAYDPSSHTGRVTLAHELTHVIQQRSGPVDGTSVPGGISVSDPSDRFEREASANADRVVLTPPLMHGGAAASPRVQRREGGAQDGHLSDPGPGLEQTDSPPTRAGLDSRDRVTVQRGWWDLFTKVAGRTASAAATPRVTRTYQPGQLTNRMLAEVLRNPSQYITSAVYKTGPLEAEPDPTRKTNPGTDDVKVWFWPGVTTSPYISRPFIYVFDRNNVSATPLSGSTDLGAAGPVSDALAEGYTNQEQITEVQQLIKGGKTVDE